MHSIFPKHTRSLCSATQRIECLNLTSITIKRYCIYVKLTGTVFLVSLASGLLLSISIMNTGITRRPGRSSSGHEKQKDKGSKGVPLCPFAYCKHPVKEHEERTHFCDKTITICYHYDCLCVYQKTCRCPNFPPPPSGAPP